MANAEIDSEAASTATTIAYQYTTSTFVLAASAIDGLALKVASRTAGATGTVTVILANNTTPGAREGSVTLNVSDFANLQANQGWWFFRFASNVTPNGTDAYKIGVLTSVAGTLTFYSSATTNWSRLIRLTANAAGAPAAADKFMIMGEWTAGAPDVLTSWVVTMDSTATTSYGPTVSGGPPQGLTINNGGTLAYGNTAATNYKLYLKGILGVFAGGTFTIDGAAGGTFPSTSTALLWFADVAAVPDSGLVAYGGTATYPVTITFNGNPLTYDRAFLAADVIAGATALTTDVSTGWSNGDVIALASTTRTIADCESKALTGGAVGTALAITALSAAHSGTAPIAGELANLTRNITISGASATTPGYINISATAIVNWNWTAFTWIGSGTANKRGIDVNTTTGTFVANRCSFYIWTVVGSLMYFNPTAASLTGTVTVTNNVFYNIADIFMAFGVANTYTWNATITGNLCIKTITTTSYGISSTTSAQLNFPFQNNTIVGCANVGIYIANVTLIGTWSGNTVHSCGNYGVLIIACTGGSMNNLTSWRNTNCGLMFYGNAANTDVLITGMTLNNLTAFGNSSTGVYFGSGLTSAWTICDSCTFDGWNIYAGTTLTQIAGITCAGAVFFYNSIISNCTMGSPTTHTTGDLYSSGAYPLQMVFHNTLFNSSTPFSGQANLRNQGSFVGIQKYNQIENNHKTFKLYGTISTDATIYYSMADGSSERLTPSNASNALESGKRRTSVALGNSITFSCYVRISSAGDGTAYNGGTMPGLWLLANPAAGIVVDTLLAPAANTPGVWQLLSGASPVVTSNSVLEVAIRCVGTAGWVNVNNNWTVA